MYPTIRAAYVGIIGDFLTHTKVVPAATNTENTVEIFFYNDIKISPAHMN